MHNNELEEKNIIREDIYKFTPYISIVISVYNSENLL